MGIIGGWILRADRCAKEKIAVSAELAGSTRIAAVRTQSSRRTKQEPDGTDQPVPGFTEGLQQRAKELSDSLKEAFARRDELQRQLKDVRGNLEVAIAQRDRLHTNLQNQNVKGHSSALKEKDDKIFRLSRELTSWQSRVPPLVERFQERDKQARALEEELESVRIRLEALEDMVKSDQTRIEPVDAESLPDGGDASNESMAMTSSHDSSRIQDQIDGDDYLPENESSNEAFDDTSEDGTSFGAFDTSEDESSFAAVFSEPEPGFEPDDDGAIEHIGDADIGNSMDAGAVDDLKAIKGIGPSIEKTLIELGITRFHQIAEMSEYDIDRVAQQLKGFRSRIYREDWIGQARDLQTHKNGDLS